MHADSCMNIHTIARMHTIANKITKGFQSENKFKSLLKVDKFTVDIYINVACLGRS
jgi:hypothetical protein